MWACLLIIWETVLFCSRKAVCRVTKDTDGTNYLENGVDAAENMLPTVWFLRMLLPKNSFAFSASQRRLKAAIPKCCVYSLNWRPLGKLRLLFLIPWFSEIPILCFPPFLYSITKRYVTDSHCNSSLLNVSVNCRSSGKKGCDKIWMTCMWSSLGGGSTLVFCCTELPTGSQLGAIVSLGRVGRVGNFPLRKLGIYCPGSSWIRLPGVIQFIRNSPSTVLLWGKGKWAHWELWVSLTALNLVETQGCRHCWVV